MANPEDDRVYFIKHASGKCCMDLNGNDKQSILAYPLYKTDNQKWYLQQFGNEWTIKNMMTGDYLGLGPSGIVQTSPLRASQTEFRWRFEKDVNDPQTWKIRVANTNWFIDLANGSTDAGTVIFLWEGDPKNPNQRWTLQYHDASA